MDTYTVTQTIISTMSPDAPPVPMRLATNTTEAGAIAAVAQAMTSTDIGFDIGFVRLVSITIDVCRG